MKKLFLAPVFILLLVSCGKEQNELIRFGTVKINFSHYAEIKVPHKYFNSDLNTCLYDTFTYLKPLVFDTLIYDKTFGEKFGISKLEYYVSNITFWKNETMVYKADTVAYIDARNVHTCLMLPNVPTGDYDRVSYFIGIGSDRNILGSLPATPENINMEWPLSMGGGYHFMKMEGYWKNKTTQKIQSGFAIHLGSNGYAVYGEYRPMKLEVKSGDVNTMNFRMNLNEWWRSPNIYSIDVNGNQTMGNATLMNLIKENGLNAFEIYQ